jgi:phosphoribosyl 1,2-cyclic phosphodiesterase
VRFASLGSGSRGNALLVEEGGTTVLVDCGFSMREATRRLRRLGVEPGDLSAILVTHEHGDHAQGVAPLSRRYRIPVWMTAGTRHGCRDADCFAVHTLRAETVLEIGDLQVHPYTVPHDAREPCQFVFSDGARRLGVLTDAGRPTAHLREMLHGCDGLLIECNHDTGMLADGPYPAALKARVGGPYGHLSNGQAAELLGGLRLPGLRHVVAMHLSEQNNTPALAAAALAGALGCAPREIPCASQDEGFGWRTL